MSYVFLPHLKKFNLSEESYNLISTTKVHMLPENVLYELAHVMLEADMTTNNDKELLGIFKTAPKEVNDMFLKIAIEKYKELSIKGYDIDKIITSSFSKPERLEGIDFTDLK